MRRVLTLGLCVGWCTAAWAGGISIPAGSNFFAIVGGGGQSTMDFSKRPLPPDFFFLGSEPFAGKVFLTGRILQKDPLFRPVDGPDLGNTSLILNRLTDANLRGPGDSTNPPVVAELVAIAMESIQPVVVRGGGVETQWDVDVATDTSVSPRPGTVTISQDVDSGGRMGLALNFDVIIAFTDRNNPSRRVSFQEALTLTGVVDWVRDPQTSLDPPVAPEDFELSFEQNVLPTTPDFGAGFFDDPEGGLAHCGVAILSDIDTFLFLPVVTAQTGTEIDTDGDGVVDPCDNCAGLVNPFQEDDDGDAVGDDCSSRDECLVAAGSPNDCNGNGIDDLCDVQLGFSGDCNGDFIPDECQADLNGNGQPDDCDDNGGMRCRQDENTKSQAAGSDLLLLALLAAVFASGACRGSGRG